MSLDVICNGCGRTIRMREKHAGKKVRCPQCSTINRLPDDNNSATDVESRICPICGFDLWIDADQVEDERGRRYHGTCYRQEAPKTKTTRRDATASVSGDSDVVKLYQTSKRRRPAPREPRPPIDESQVVYLSQASKGERPEPPPSDRGSAPGSNGDTD